MHPYRQDFGLQALAPTGRALYLAHELLGLFARPVTVGLVALALQPLHDAVVSRLVTPHATITVLVLNWNGFGVHAQEHELSIFGPQLRPRRVDVESAQGRDAADEALEVLKARAGPRREGAVGEGQRGVGHHEVGVHLVARAQSRAHRAGAVGRVEGEVARREFAKTDPTVTARHLLRELHHLIGVEEEKLDDALREFEGRLHRFGQSLTISFLHGQSVQHHVDGVLFVARQG